jgi:hypothetical protein
MVPRGWWHQTHAPEASVSFTFKLGAPSGGEVILDALKRRLERVAEWRRPLLVPKTEAQKSQHRERLMGLLELMRGEADIEKLFPRNEPVPRYRLRPGVELRFSGLGEGDDNWLLDVSNCDLEVIEVDFEPVDFCRALAESTSGLTLDELYDVCPGTLRGPFSDLLTTLTEHGVLERTLE